MRISSFKKTICIILICLLALPLEGFVSFGSTTTAAITNTLNYYREKVYLQNWHWDTGNPLTAQSGTCSSSTYCTTTSFGGAWQCQGFALCLANAVLGSYPKGSLSSYTNGLKSGEWVCYTRSALGVTGLENLGLQPGDIVRAASDSKYSNGHTALVWKVENGKVYFAEAWGSKHSKINWGGFDYYSYSMSEICSRYAYVALWRNTTVVNTGATVNPLTCSHDYSEYYEKTHPHEYYLKCKICGNIIYEGSYYKDPNCLCCSGVHSFTTYYEEVHPHNEVKKCTLCGYLEYTGNSHTDDNCEHCRRVPYGLSLAADREEISLGETIKLTYAASYATQIKINIYKDSVLWQSFDRTSSGVLSLTIEETGFYRAELVASNTYGSGYCESAPSFCAEPHIEKIADDGDFIFITYTDPMTTENAKDFATQRKGELYEYDGSGFTLKISKTPVGEAESGERKFEVYEGGFTYGEALEISAFLGGTLAKITSEEENNCLGYAMAQTNLTEIWIGLSDEDTNGKWCWPDGSALDFSSWSAAHSGVTDESFSHAAFYRSGKWCETVLSSPEGFAVSYRDGESYVSMPFKDVYMDRWYYPGVAFCYSRCLMNGTGATAFSPNLTLTRAQIVTVLAKMSAEDTSEYANRSTFIDVKESSYYHASLEWAHEKGMASGVGNGKFNPNGAITRQDLALMLYKYAKYVSSDGIYSDRANLTEYTDYGSISDYATEALVWAVSNGLISGTGKNIISPKATATRAQLSLIVKNFYNLQVTQ